MEDIIVFGASGHAKVVIDIIEKQGEFRIAGLTDPFKQTGGKFFGCEIVGTGEDAAGLCAKLGVSRGLIAIGDNWTRQQVHAKVTASFPEIEFVSAVHPSAVVARGVEIGAGTVVMGGAVINSSARIGGFCIVNTNASVDHDCLMGDFSSVAPNACLGGNVTLEEFSAVLIGANVSNGVSIGRHTVIGGGATVVDDMPPESLALGTPARVARARKPGEKYM